MKWLLVGLLISGLGGVGYGENNVNVENLIYTSEGNRLIRRVVNANEKSFYFEECRLSPNENLSQQLSQPKGECTAISPKFLNNAETLEAINHKFKANLRKDAFWARGTKYVLSVAFPTAAYFSGRAAYLRWVVFRATPSFRAGFSTGAFTLLTYALATAAFNTWRSSVPEIDADLQHGNVRIDREYVSPNDPLTVYKNVKSALQRAAFDCPPSRQVSINCDGAGCSTLKYSTGMVGASGCSAL